MSTLLSGLLAYYTLDNTAHDAFGGHHGVEEEMTYTTAKLGAKSADFNGSGHISVLHGSWMDVSSISVSLWMYPTVWSVAYTSVFSIQQAASPWQAFDLRKNSANDYLEGWYVAGGVGTSLNTPNLITINNWHHIVFTYDQATHTAIIYQNAVAGTPNTSVTGSLTSTAADLWFGGNYGAGGRYFTGRIDDTAIWNRALNSSEVTELYNGGSGKAWPWMVPNILGGKVGAHLIVTD